MKENGKITELKDLIRSPGWLYLREQIRARREGTVAQLIVLQDEDKIRSAQVWVQALDYLSNLPHQLIQEDRYGRQEINAETK